MAEVFRIEVQIDPAQAARGAKTVEKSLESVDSTATKLQSTLKRAFVGLTLVAAVKEVFDLTDAYTQLQNRLRVVVDGQGQLELATGRLLDVSNRTRSSFEKTVELYARVALSTRGLGKSQDQLLSITESVNKAIILSGAGAKEANNGLIQLSQGISSNRLGGDELRSVLEQLPVVADVIAKQMGVTRGELKKVAETGSITGKVILDAFESARKELDEKFAKTIPTVGQALQVLRNNAVDVFGQIGKSSGLVQGVAGSLIFLASNLKIVIQLLALTATVFAAVKVGEFVQGILTAAEAYRAFRAAIASGNAVLLGSAEATSQQIAFETEKIQVQVASTQSTIAAARAEQARGVVALETTAAFRDQAAAEVLRAQATIATTRASVGAAEAELVRAQAFAQTLKFDIERDAVLANVAVKEAALADIRATLAVETEALTAATAQLDVATEAGNAANAIRIAQDAQLAALDATLTVETEALAVANLELAAAQGAAAAESTILGSTFGLIKREVSGLFALIAANPIVAAVVALAAILAPLIIFRNEIKLSGEGLATLGDLFAELKDRVVSGLSVIGDFFKKVFGGLNDLLGGVFSNVEFSFAGVLRFIAQAVDKTFGLLTGLITATIRIFTGLGPALGDLAIQAVNGLLDAFEFGANGVSAFLATMGKNASRFLDGLIAAFLGAGEAISQALQGNFDAAATAAKTSAKAILDGTLGVIKDTPQTFIDSFNESAAQDLVPKLNNAFAGEASSFGTSVGESFVAGLKDTTASDFVEGLLGGAEARAAARKAAEDAAKAASAKAPDATIGTTRNKHVSDIFEELRDREKLLSLINLTNQDREIEADLLKIVDHLKKQGIGITADELEELRIQISVNKSLEDQVQLINDLRGLEEGKLRRLSAAEAALNRGAISAEEYAHAIRLIEESSRTVFQSAVHDLENQNKLLGIIGKTSVERQRQVALESQLQALRAQGEDPSKSQIKELNALIVSNAALNRQNDLVNEYGAIDDRTDALTRGAHAGAQYAKTTEDLRQRTEDANAAFDRGALTGAQYAVVLRDIELDAAAAGKSIQDGFTTGFAQVQDQLTDLASLTSNALVNAFSSAEDALVQFASTGKFSFREFASSIITDILRIISRMLVLQALQAALGLFAGSAAGVAPGAGTAGIDGPAIGGLGGLPARAGGGIVGANKPYIVGENGPELFRPSSSGMVMSNDQTIEAFKQAAGAAGGSATVNVPTPQVTIEITNSIDAGEVVHQGLNTEKGTRSFVNHIGKNKDTIKRTTA